MTKIIQSSSPMVILLCMLMVIQFAGCGGDTNDDDDDIFDATVSEAPPLPPAESMIIDLSTFDDKVLAPSTAPLVTYKNFGNAVLRVGVVSAGLVGAASVPAAVFAAAIFNPPVPQGIDKWLWRYTVTVEYVTFSAALTAEINEGSIDWTMVVSSDAPLHPVEDFTWYTGTSTGSNLAGSWQFYDISTPDGQNPTISIDWSASEIDGTVDLAVEDMDSRPENEYAGDSLVYDIDADIATLSYEDVSEGAVWKIVWDRNTGAGSIKVPEYNGGEEACWNEQKQDVICN